jgi:hypothetical protein
MISLAREYRAILGDLEKNMRTMLANGVYHDLESRPGQNFELHENLLLALRHVEDARMRLGKFIQHSGSGQSCYDPAAGNPAGQPKWEPGEQYPAEKEAGFHG